MWVFTVRPCFFPQRSVLPGGFNSDEKYVWSRVVFSFSLCQQPPVLVEVSVFMLLVCVFREWTGKRSPLDAAAIVSSSEPQRRVPRRWVVNELWRIRGYTVNMCAVDISPPVLAATWTGWALLLHCCSAQATLSLFRELRAFPAHTHFLWFPAKNSKTSPGDCFGASTLLVWHLCISYLRMCPTQRPVHLCATGAHFS